MMNWLEFEYNFVEKYEKLISNDILFTINKICNCLKIDIKIIHINRNYHSIVHNKKIIAYILHYHLFYSYNTIAKIFNCNHSTIVYYCKSINNERKYNKILNQNINNILKTLNL